MFVDLIKAEEFPIDELRGRFRELLEGLTRIDAMTDDERRGFATEIFSLFREIAEREARVRFEYEWLEGRGKGSV